MRQVLLILLMALSFQGWSQKEKERQGFSADRIFFGGDITFNISNQVTAIGASPLVGYRITDKWSAGLGVTYLYYSIDYGIFGQYNTSIYGGNVFTRVLITEQLFLQTEFHVINTDAAQYNPVTDAVETIRRNVPMWYVGGGYRVALGGNAYAALSVLYDVIDDPYSPYSNPNIRAGFVFGL
jgi:outer membrane protein assembly factor BamA